MIHTSKKGEMANVIPFNTFERRKVRFPVPLALFRPSDLSSHCAKKSVPKATYVVNTENS